MSGALEGIRVIDFGQYVAGPLLAMMFADQGAEVIRVDPPGGPRWQNHANAVLQRGKRSIVLDLKKDADASTARRLVETADVVIESFRPGVMKRLGLGAEEMLAANPRLVYCSIPGFAADDPRCGVAAYEGVVEAAAGIYPPSTWDEDPAGGAPVYNALPLSSTFAAVRAGQGVIAALIARQRDGRGQRLEVPLFDATFEMTGPRCVRLPGQQSRIRSRSKHDFILDAQFECADGRWVNLSWLERRQLPRFAAKFGAPDWEKDGLLNEDEYRSKDTPESEELKRRLIPIFKSRTAAEWGRVANPDSDLAECLTTSDWLNTEEHARTTCAVISLQDPEFGETRQLGYPFTMSKTPSQASPRHTLNADRDAIIAELDAATRAQAAEAPARAENLSRALEGMRVLDLAQVLAGPTCGRILAEYGADVVKVNNPKARDVAYHQYVNSGKRTMLLDLKSAEGQDVLWRLMEKADVLSLNFSPPACEHLGLTEENVRRHRPDIVYSSISAFGWNGPRGNHRGHEQLGQAVSGVETRWGKGFREPVMQSFPICDMGTGNLAAFSIMLALFHRLRTGEGQFVATSLAQTGTYHQAPFMLDYAGRVWDEVGGQEARGSGPLNRMYRASDRWFFIAALGAGGLNRLCRVEGLEGVEKAGEGLEAALSARFATQAASGWVARLTAAGIGAHAVRTVEENMEDEAIKARGLSVEREYPQIGLVRTTGPSGRLSRTPARLNYPSQPPGTNNREVLEDVGLAASHDDLMAKGVIAVGVGAR